jgi:uncharacterized protein
MTVTQLFIYPVKSLAGIAVQEASLSIRGFLHDRSWMIVDENNLFISQRSRPAMSLIKVALSNNTLQLFTDADTKGVQLPLEPTIVQATVQVKVWDSVCEVIDGFEEANIWLSQQLSISCRLVYMPEDTKRFINSDLVPKGAVVSFADGYPYLILGTASLTDLNGRLESPVDVDRFRPNIVIETEVPFEEDHWKTFHIGQSIFTGVKPCARCVVVNVNQQTAESSKEPLKTLATYREVDNKVLFGLNSLWSGGAERIHVGDTVSVGRLLQKNI